MKLAESLQKQSSKANNVLGRIKKPKVRAPIVIRRVMGFSMAPALLPGKLVWGRGWFWRLRRGNIVIVLHEGKEKIKRVAELDKTNVYVLGDNPGRSTDSRHFGWIPRTQVVAKIISRR